jgi:hypothetical protein
MSSHISVLAGATIASIAAGPLFVSASMAAFYYAQMPSAVPVAAFDPESLGPFAALIALVVSVGFIFAFIPNLVGAKLMYAAGLRWEAARYRPVWILVGASSSAAVTLLFGANVPEMTFGFATTGSVCAAICHRWADWAPELRRANPVVTVRQYGGYPAHR